MTFRPLAGLVLAATLGLSACNTSTDTQNMVGTGAASAAIGAIAATALGANAGWTLAAAAAAGAAGALYARNEQTNECAYHTGDGETVTVKDC
ncbi:hypothetical protein [Pseudoruegeria sp. SK021]|uniref:hypothetical protein n=1 Tax=Pseudoruegeria sp. SK021 TaxID=1933035 RepID=UPI000A2156E2|nr:hypothetical protein [Pseudoruegeria sp. SK021]OSP54945.1 hypothetical protein BV911_09860 [Pseudoruegeria sp. SK021]